MAREPEAALLKSQEELEELVERFEGKTRHLGGTAGWLVTTALVLMSLYHLYAAQATFVRQIHLTIHLLFVLVLTFLLYPARRERLDRITPTDAVLAGLAALSLGYILWDFEAFIYRAVVPTTVDLVLGTVLILLVLEATRRAVGRALLVLVLAFLLYAFAGPWLPPPFTHRGYDLARVVGQLYMTLEGIFGVPLEVSSTFIILFTIYGSFLEQSGAGKFFVDLALALVGRRRTGPGQAVTVASFLLGGPSGSGVATTVSVGAIAYPLLKRAGYDREAAGGLLSAGGIGAVISPPILGAAAFIIAEILKISYLQVIKMAIIPTILYYVAVFFMIELDARRFRLSRVEIRTESAARLMLRYWYLLSSLVVIPLFMILGLTAITAVLWATMIALVTSFLRRETALAVLMRRERRHPWWPWLLVLAVMAYLGWVTVGQGIPVPRPGAIWRGATILFVAVWVASAALFFVAALTRGRLGFGRIGVDTEKGVAALANGSRQVLSVAVTTAAAGIIVGVTNLTGLGLKIADIIVSLAGGNLLFTLVLAGISLWVLGLALPITATYIIAAVMVAPALTKLGVSELAAHMFIFYYAILSEVSPPVGLSPMAAAALTGGNAFKTMLQAWKYTLPAFVVPFMFTVHPAGVALLLETGEWLEIVKITATAVAGLAALAAAVGGWLLRPATGLERVLLAAAGLTLVYPATGPDLVAAAVIAMVIILQVRRPLPLPATPGEG
ncbi:MAG: TRAP transporter fused permease subunit [Armatimonadota bacterium]|nr:TRAP transporter fused permease subunit [Armatimonadota bacterium]MDR7427607.1 TRAP transporter fused permease subunit [Armatimonadota bacterium]MDR7475869.1 TRAP transporter fused permease subunit [Armatimonadota bacterium]MDR7538295.1 TRAP transporter fused permease subunit [Armatimonadota bacterium]